MVEMTKAAFVFPGQGSQSVGMGRDLYDNFPAAKAIFDQADNVLGFSISQLCFAGPDDELRKTVNAQPALVTMSFACLQAARAAGAKLPQPAFTAGHSLGEYTALAFAGVLDFGDAVRLARERGRLMYEAGTAQPGSMAAVLGLDEAVLAEVCRQTGVWLANINCPGQLVISGAVMNLNQAMEQAKARGASRVVPLQVSGAFHTPLMQLAADGLSKMISTLQFREPAITIIGNVNAQPLTTAQAVKDELLKQLTSPVQWQRSVEYMAKQNTGTFYEIGPGKVLSGLIKRINKEAATVNIGDVAAIKAL
ncbi:MAG: ACP S-malonyltransferase [Dehalococcoidales bacterium]|nr:ACP S-malonyltransferase [Dehalococcoidales bacterium]